MLVALMLHSAGNSTPRCSKLIEPSRQLVMTTSRRSQTTSSYGCTPAVVKTRLILRPLPRAGALALRRVRAPAKRSSVSVIVWSSPSSWMGRRLGKSRNPYCSDWCLSGGTDSSGSRWSSGAGAADGDGVGHGRPRLQFGDLLLEVGDRGEGAVDAGEAQVRHFVQLTQGPEDGQAHLVAGDLRGTGGADGVLDLLGQQLELVLGDRPALTGPADTGDHLGAIEGFAHAAALHDGEHRLLDG